MASSGGSEVLQSSAAPSVTSVERRGIEHIPQSERWGRPSSQFWMWAGAVWKTVQAEGQVTPAS